MADGNTAVVVRSGSMLPANLSEASQLAEDIAKSRLFGCKTREEAMGLMLLADAEGLHPAAAARDYHIIDGRPSLKADAMLARFQASGGKVEWLTRTDTEVSATFTHDLGGSLTITWNWERASRIQRKNKKLVDGDNWKNYPAQMLSARVISEGVRAVFPGITQGMYTPEEIMDFEPAPQQQPPHMQQQALPPANEPQKASKGASRELYSKLQAQVRDHDSLDSLQAWGEANADRIGMLPPDWAAEIRAEYKKELMAFKAQIEAEQYNEADPAEQHPEMRV